MERATVNRLSKTCAIGFVASPLQNGHASQLRRHSCPQTLLLHSRFRVSAESSRSVGGRGEPSNNDKLNKTESTTFRRTADDGWKWRLSRCKNESLTCKNRSTKSWICRKEPVHEYCIFQNRKKSGS